MYILSVLFLELLYGFPIYSGQAYLGLHFPFTIFQPFGLLAGEHYRASCRLAPDLVPAREGLVQSIFRT